MQPMQHADMMILWNSRVGMITADDVERALGIDRRNASNLLSAMFREGYVTRVDRGIYHWSTNEEDE